MKTNSTLVIFAGIAALGLVTVLAVNIMLTAQEAEARGCSPNSIAANASLGRCIQSSTAELTAEDLDDEVEDHGEENAGEDNEDSEL